jgi:hypothetical protein
MPRATGDSGLPLRLSSSQPFALFPTERSSTPYVITNFQLAHDQLANCLSHLHLNITCSSIVFKLEPSSLRSYSIMPRLNRSTIAIQPALGKRKTFDEASDQEADYSVAGPSGNAGGSAPAEDDGDDDDWSDEDDAPEAVTAGAARNGMTSQEEAVAKWVASSHQYHSASVGSSATDQTGSRYPNEKQRLPDRKPLQMLKRLHGLARRPPKA